MRFCRQAAITALVVSTACASQRPPALAAGGQSTLAMQKRVLAALTGETEIATGLKLANRFDIANRRAARDYIAATLKELGLTPQRQSYGAEGENVYAELKCGKPGADAIVLGAHYDSVRVAPGANDDGTGVVTVLGVARELTRSKPKLHDVIFVFFDEEERGLVGARNFAQMLKDTNRAVHSVHTIDQVGWDSNHNRAIELELPFDGILDIYKQAAARLKMDIIIHVTTETGSDHNAFRRLGFKAVGVTEEYRNKDTTPYYHKATDTYATVDFDYVASTTKLVTEAMRLLTQEVR
jgi:acetylornithine deacetylase/succinyl-diaminopimelate desuccinylase-like protein